MARIQRYQAQQGLQPQAGPVSNLRAYDAEALQGVGRGIEQLGAAITDRNQRRATMEDTDNYQLLQARLNTSLFEQEQNIPAGGAGFTTGYMTEFDRMSEEYLSGITDPDIREQRARDIATLREQYSLRAARTEAGEVSRYQGNLISREAEGAFARIEEDPDRFQGELDAMVGLVRASNLPPARQEELIAELQRGGSAVYLSALAELDPMRLLRETGGDLGQLDPATAASITLGVLEEHGNVPVRQGERVGPYGMLRSDLAVLAVEEGVDVANTPGGLEGIVSNPTTARFYAQRHLERLMERYEDPRDAVVAFYMGDEYVAGGWTVGDLPRSVQQTLRVTFDTLPVPGNRASTPSGAAGGGGHPRSFGSFTGYGVMDRAAYAIAARESSGGDYSQVNPESGATGAFQVMPQNIGPWTERWVGRRMSQAEFLASPAAQDAVFRGQFGMYMEQYGSFEAASIAWFSGGSRAEAWLAGDRDRVGALSDGGNTVNQYLEFVGPIFNEGGGATGAGAGGGGNIPLTQGNGVPFPASSLDDIDPFIITTAQNVLAQFGLTEVPVLDAERPDNADYGVSNSQHIVFDSDGNPTGRRGALDISIAGMSRQQVIELVQAFSAAGITGIGVYRNSKYNHIHIDMGGRRHWIDRDGVTTWALPVLQQHSANAFNGMAQPNRTGSRGTGSVSAALGGASPGDVVSAQQAAIEQLTGANRSTDVIREEAQLFLDDTIASFQNGGDLPPTDLLEQNLAVLTPNDQRKYREEIQIETTTRAMTEGIEEMERGDMLSLQNQIRDPNGVYASTAIGRRIIDTVESRIADEENLRANNPAAAAIRVPEVEQAWMAVVVDPETGVASGEAVQEYIRISRQVQMTRYGLTEAQVQTLPTEQLAILADRIDDVTRNPEISGDRRDTLMTIFAAQLYNMFGDEADDVLANVVDYMHNGPPEEAPEARLVARLNRTMRMADQGDLPRSSGGTTEAVIPSGDGDPVLANPDDYDTSTPDAVLASVRRAASQAQLLSDRMERAAFIESLPAEIRTLVGEMLN